MSDQNQWQNAAWGAPLGGAPSSGGPSAGQGQAAPAQPAASQPAAPGAAPQATSQPQAQANPCGYGAPQPRPSYAGQPQGAYAAQAQAQPAAAYAVPAQSVPAQQPKRRGWIVGLAAVLTVLILGVATIGSCTSVFTSSMGAFSYESPSWADTVTGDTVGIINISGTIQYDGTTSSPEGLKSQLDAAEQNPHIKAVVLRVNSGGGVATAGEEMSTYIRDFSKPVVVSSASINASAAYMVSSQADYIFTDRRPPSAPSASSCL